MAGLQKLTALNALSTRDTIMVYEMLYGHMYVYTYKQITVFHSAKQESIDVGSCVLQELLHFEV